MKARIPCFVALAVLLASPQVMARSERQLDYRFSQTWAASVRLLRVDMKCKILEKDKDTGYLLFDCTDGAKSTTGSLELVRGATAQRTFIKVSLHMEKMPTYVETHWLSKLVKKLKSDYGDPVTAAPASQASGSAGSGKNADSEDGATLNKHAEDEKDLEVDEEDLEDANEER